MKREEILDTINSMLKKHLAGQRDQQFVRYLDPDQLQELLHLEDCSDGADWHRIFQWVQMYLDRSVKTGHPGFINRMWGAANLPSIVGEFTAAVANTSACTFESAPVSTLMEKYMLQEMLDLAGFTNGEGQMTTGSSNANMLAMMAARNEILPEVKAEGLRQLPDIVGFVSADAHYSMEKAANILGLRTRRLIKIPVTHSGEMHVGMLIEKIDNFRQTSDGLQRSDSLLLTNGQGFHAIGEPGRFDNSIHQVYADEETLSFHLSSDDAVKGQVFSSMEERNR